MTERMSGTEGAGGTRDAGGGRLAAFDVAASVSEWSVELPLAHARGHELKQKPAYARGHGREGPLAHARSYKPDAAARSLVRQGNVVAFEGATEHLVVGGERLVLVGECAVERKFDAGKPVLAVEHEKGAAAARLQFFHLGFE